jgi:hypothetical protein
VVKQGTPIPPFEKGGLGGILTLNPPHSPFSKGEVLHGVSLLAVITVVTYNKSIPPLKKEGASCYGVLSSHSDPERLMAI